MPETASHLDLKLADRQPSLARHPLIFDLFLILFSVLFFLSGIRAICPRPDVLYPGMFVGNQDLRASPDIIVKLVYLPYSVREGKDYKIRTLIAGADSVFTASEFAENYFLRVTFSSFEIEDKPSYEVPFDVDYSSLTTELALNDWINANANFKPRQTVYQGSVRLDLVEKHRNEIKSSFEHSFSRTKPAGFRERMREWINEYFPKNGFLYGMGLILVTLCLVFRKNRALPAALITATPFIFALGLSGRLPTPYEIFKVSTLFVFLLYLCFHLSLLWRNRESPVAAKTESILLWIMLIAGMFAFVSAVSAGFNLFLWGPFEERDYLIARQVASFQAFPVMGPQLAHGGQVPGGFLYFLYAPLIWIWDDPRMIALFNLGLYVLGAVYLFRFLNREFGHRAAVITSSILLVSPIFIGYALWPIHPSVSFAFNVLLFIQMYQLAVHRKSGCFAVCCLLLAFLMQLHFSYFMLIPVLGSIAFWRRKEIRAAHWVVGFLTIAFLYLPYVIYEMNHHWANFRLILNSPRRIPTYPVVERFANPMVIQMNLKWLLMGDSPVHRLLSIFCWVATGFGLWRVMREDNLRFHFLLVGYAIPIVILAFLGIGQNLRHFILIVPLIFLWVGLGVESMIRFFPLLGRMFLAAMTLLLVITALRSPQETAALSRRYIREWSRPYGERSQIAESIARMGVTPEDYRKKVFWFWVGWTMAPELYDRVWRKVGGDTGKRYQEKEGILVLDTEYWPFMLKNMELEKIADMNAGLTMSRYKMKIDHPLLSNARNVTFLNEEERGLEHSFYPEGVHLIEKRVNQNQTIKIFVVSIHGGKIVFKCELTGFVEDGYTRYEWRIVSSHLNGYYQEIKQIRRPYLKFVSPGGELLGRKDLAYHVLGGLLERTPIRGSIRVKGKPDEHQIFFGHEGFFDLASMNSPQLQLWERAA